MKFLYMFPRDAYGVNTEFMSWAADVKEMYDSLPQEDIIKAITWILKTVQKSSRRDFVCVNLKDRKKHHLGKGYNLEETVSISFEKIFEISSFEIKNDYVVLGGAVFLQKKGCPTGGPGSPNSSSAVCIFYEHQFRISIYHHLYFVYLFRYFDDLRAITVYDLMEITIKYLAIDLLVHLQHCTYHSCMNLILEQNLENSFKFLEGEFNYS